MLKKIAQRAKGRHSKKHGKRDMLPLKKIKSGKPLSKTELESKKIKKPKKS
jgi:hypothetical protein